MFIRLLKIVSDKRQAHNLHGPTVPTGTLKQNDLQPTLISHHGLPSTSSILAYDFIFGLLAVGSRDGRIKLFGRPGVEVCLVSETSAPCKFLEFLSGSGYLIQASTRKDIEVWSLEAQCCVTSLQWPNDITAFAISQDNTYIYIGDEAGALSVLKFELGKLHTLPYSVPPHVTMAGLVKPGRGSPPALVGILLQPGSVQTRLVLAYDNGILVLWDAISLAVVAIRGGSEHQRVCLAEAGDSLQELMNPRPIVPSAGQTGIGEEGEDEEEDMEEREICSLCWASDNGSLVACGYTDGSVSIWALPSDTGGKRHGKMSLSKYSGEPWGRVKLQGEGTKMSVIMLQWHPDEANQSGGRLYLFGGTAVGLPQVVWVVPLSSVDSPATYRKLPWFGPVSDMRAIQSKPTSTLPRRCLLVLTAPGQLHCWDDSSVAEVLAESSTDQQRPLPSPTSLAFRLGESPVTAFLSAAVSHGSEAASTVEAQGTAASAREPSVGLLPVTGGQPAPAADGAADMYHLLLTGHNHGVVQVWEASQLPPCPIASTAPLAISLEGRKLPTLEQGGVPLPGITTMAFCPESFLLALGHKGGLVSLHVLCSKAGTITRRTLEAGGTLQSDRIVCAPGFQLFGLLKLHHSSITSVALATTHSLLAAGDAHGRVSLLDIHKFEVLLNDVPFRGGAAAIAQVTSLILAPLTGPTPGPKHPDSPTEHLSEEAPLPSPTHVEERLFLHILTSDCMLTLFDIHLGNYVTSKPFKPKHPGKACSLLLLDAFGAGVQPLHSKMHLDLGIEESLEAAHPTPPPAASDYLQVDSGEDVVAAVDSVSVEVEVALHDSPDMQDGEESESLGQLVVEQGHSSSHCEPQPSHLLPQGALDPKTAGDLEGQEDATHVQSPHFQNLTVLPEDGQAERSAAPTAEYIMLVSQLYVRLYPALAAFQNSPHHLRKVRLFEAQPPATLCKWCAVFQHPHTRAPGLLLVSNKGDMEIRSLPDLSLLLQGDLSHLLTWKYEPSATFQLSATCDGLLTMLLAESELALISLFPSNDRPKVSLLPAKEDDVPALEPTPKEPAKDIADSPQPGSTALDRISQVFGGVVAIAGGLSISLNSHFTAAKPSAEKLESVLLTAPFVVRTPRAEGVEDDDHDISTSLSAMKLDPIAIEGHLEDKDPDSDSDPEEDGKKVEEMSAIEKQEPHKSASEKLGDLFHFIRGDKSKDASRARSELLNEDPSHASTTAPPRARTVAEIKAAYGTKISESAASAASDAKARLHERGEKLQEVANQTEELENSAADFANIAELLMKKEQGRKWWHLR